MLANKTRISRRLRQSIWRNTLLAHRWVGISVGIVVLMWCISGVVMMYVQYPELKPVEQLAALQSLSSVQCCNGELPSSISAAMSGPYMLEVLSGKPVFRFQSTNRQLVLDIEAKQWIDSWPEEDLRTVGTDYALRQGWGVPEVVTRVERDQWTVQGRFDPHRPMLKFENPEGRSWYVSSSTAQIVQVTNRSERFWNWLGSVPHWLYPTVLRQHTAIWSQVVIWLTLISLFLTITGIIIGIKHFRWRSESEGSPYKGMMIWHHYAGLFFGLFTLTWVLSGLFSMNPWGLLESRSFGVERNVLNGVDQTVSEIVDTIDAVLPNTPEGTVRLESAYWLGEPYFLAWDAHGNATRISADGDTSTLSEADINRALVELDLNEATADKLVNEDPYYYGLHEDVRLPVWRILEQSGDRYYVSQETGQLQVIVDRNAASNRWLFRALHSLDFHAVVRFRPLWDLLMILLLLGVITGVSTGTWLGLRRLIQ